MSRQVRRSVRRQRGRLASGEPLEPRLALAAGLLETLVTIVDEAGGNLLDHATAAQAAAVGEGEELVASVRLARRPDQPVTVRLATSDPLEMAPSVGALRFTRANWNIPQPVAIRSIADGVADGDQRLAAHLTVATTGRRPLTQRIWIDSLDTGEESPAVAASGVYRGTLAGGASGSVMAHYGVNEGTATFRIRAPQVPGFGNRVISIDYVVTSANEVALLAVRGVASSRVRLDLSYRMGPEGPGLSGTLELMTPAGGRAAAMRFSAALVTSVMSQIEGYAPSPATSAAVGGAPAALVVGADGTGWVANEATNAVQRLVRQGGGWTVADTIPVGTAPGAIAVSADGAAWVANTADGTIQQILKINSVWSAGSPLAVPGSPTAIVVAADGGIWIATAAADGVQRIAMVDGSPSITATLPFAEAPAALAVGSDGSIWVALAGANAVQRISAAGTGWQVGLRIPVVAGPSSLAAAADGSIWVASAASGSLQQVLRARGAWRTQPALPTAQAPADVAVHPDGSIWVAAGDSLQRFVRSRAGWVAQSPISVGGVIAAIRSAPDGTVLAADAQAGIVTAVSAVPSEVQDLAVAPTGVGELLLSWEAPATGDATGYSVTMTTADVMFSNVGGGFGSFATSTRVLTTTSDTSLVVPNPSQPKPNAFSVTTIHVAAISAEGRSSHASEAVFVSARVAGMSAWLEQQADPTARMDAVQAAVVGASDTDWWYSGRPTSSATKWLPAALLTVRRELFNQSPTVEPVQRWSDGQLIGHLRPFDAEGEELNFTVLVHPQNGTLELDDSGGYTYTPNPTTQGGKLRASVAPADSFVLGVSDPAGGGNLLDPAASGTTTAPLGLVNLSGDDVGPDGSVPAGDLTGKDLAGANLSGVNLAGATLTGSDLTLANLNSADLAGADLSGANLTNANLKNANLTSANLKSANLTSANLTSATLTSANLKSANLTSANLTSANLTSANLFSAELQRANLSYANLTGARLGFADLTSANLFSANLQRASLFGASMQYTNVSYANLTGADTLFAFLAGSTGCATVTPTGALNDRGCFD